MDAGGPRRLAWWRGGRAGTDAGLPALGRLAARARAGTIGERLSGTGPYSQPWASACPSRQLWNRDKCARSPVTDELSGLTSESWRTLELPAAPRAHRALDRHREGRRARSGRAAAWRVGGLQPVERRDRIHSP